MTRCPAPAQDENGVVFYSSRTTFCLVQRHFDCLIMAKYDVVVGVDFGMTATGEHQATPSMPLKIGDKR